MCAPGAKGRGQGQRHLILSAVRTGSGYVPARSFLLWLDAAVAHQLPHLALRVGLLAITSDAQAYKQAGNSVTVNVIEAIGRRIRAVDEQLRKEAAA